MFRGRSMRSARTKKRERERFGKILPLLWNVSCGLQ